MKSQPNAVLLLAALLIAAVAGAVGWIGRGLFTGGAFSQPAAAPPTAEISRTGSSAAASPRSQSPAGVNAEEPKVIAKRLLQAVIDGTQEEGSETLLKFRFRQALAGCDEAALAEMLESLMRYEKNLPGFDLPNNWQLPVQLTDLVMAQMSALNPRKALDFQVGLAQAGMPTSPESFFMVMALLAEQNAPDVQNVIESLPHGDIRLSAQIAWMDARSKSDPEGVFQSLMNLDSEARKLTPFYSGPLKELLNRLALQAPEKALQVAEILPPEHFFTFQKDLVRAWISRDPKAAVQWAMEKNDADTLRICLGYLSPEKGALDEKSFRDNFSSITSTEPSDGVSLSRDLAARLAEQDIHEGVRWAATLPADARDAANLALARAWIKQDESAAAEWLATWPAGQSKDEAVEALTGWILDDDPESALTWAASIQAKERFSLMQKALERLTVRDPAAAERAMQTLSEEDRAVLLVMKRTGLGE